MEAEGYPFELCERSIPEQFKTRLFGCVSIRARRCSECGLVYFVNDPNREFTICKSCWEKSKVEKEVFG